VTVKRILEEVSVFFEMKRFDPPTGATLHWLKVRNVVGCVLRQFPRPVANCKTFCKRNDNDVDGRRDPIFLTNPRTE
jgi:hypothetical protein